MTREGATAIIVAIAVLAFVLIGIGWWRRRRRDAHFVAPTTVPAGDTATFPHFEGFYVATTAHDDPLERIAVRHLTFRGRLTATVRADGVLLEIPGEPAVFLSTAALVGVGRARYAIDRVVERDGLVALRWRLTDAEGERPKLVDSYLRLMAASPDFIAAVTALGVQDLDLHDPGQHDPEPHEPDAQAEQPS